MSFKLSKKDHEERDEIVGRLNEASGNLSTLVDEFNDKVEGLKGPVEAAVEAYNEVLADARAFAERVASDAQEAIDQKSDKWQESDKGQAAVGWKDEWENLSLDDVEINFPDALEIDSLDHCGDLEQLPEEMAT